MRIRRALLFALVAVVMTSSTASADIRLTIQNGQVVLIAKDATVRQILAEWARVGHTTVINLDRVTGGPVTLQLTNVSEEQALDVILRSLSGYILARRPATVSNFSQFDRIIVMPASVAPRTAAAAPASAPVFQPPQFPQAVAAPGLVGSTGGTPTPGAAEDDGSDARQAPANRGPVFTFPQPQVVNPQAVPAAAPSVTGTTPGVPAIQGQLPATATPPAPTYPSTPTAPFGGVAVPGTVAPPPQPSQPGGAPQPNNSEGQ